MLYNADEDLQSFNNLPSVIVTSQSNFDSNYNQDCDVQNASSFEENEFLSLQQYDGGHVSVIVVPTEKDSAKIGNL